MAAGAELGGGSPAPGGGHVPLQEGEAGQRAQAGAGSLGLGRELRSSMALGTMALGTMQGLGLRLPPCGAPPGLGSLPFVLQNLEEPSPGSASHTCNKHTCICTHISIRVHTYTHTYIHYKHTHLHAHHILSPCSGTLAAHSSFSLSRLGPRSPTCRSPRPLTKPRPRTSWCTQSCCGGPWTTSPAEVRRPRQSEGRVGGGVTPHGCRRL